MLEVQESVRNKRTISRPFPPNTRYSVDTLLGPKVTMTFAPAGRKEIAKFNSKLEGDEGGVDVGEGGDKEVSTTISRGLCSVWNYVSTLTRDLLVGPPTDLDNCVNAFFDTSDLKGGYWVWAGWACPSVDEIWARASMEGCVPAWRGVSQHGGACPSMEGCVLP